jgi:heme-degrading monooxygenase HmoA
LDADGRIMHAIIWRFEVEPGCEQEFVEAYGPKGAWAKLFCKAEGFVGVELLRDTSDRTVFLTIDRWRSVEDYEGFKERFAAEYGALDREMERFAQSERKIGDFDVTKWFFGGASPPS